jgi:hypothetical protein
LAIIRAAKPEKFLELDSQLLEESSRLMPRLPFDMIDVLVVDEMGKDISGTGMDANVVGRRCIRGAPDLPVPKITRIVVLSLTEGAMGNAHGVGMADIVTERLIKQIDWKATMQNALTTQFPEKAMTPLAFPTDREAAQAALGTCWVRDASRARLVRIRNTRDLERLYISESLLEEAKSNSALEITGPGRRLFAD